MGHLLVTNDYPPKIGGIQSYLYELWRRLPSERVTVLTTSHRDSPNFDAVAPHRIVRLPKKVLLPTQKMIDTINKLADTVDASLVILDPVFPLGIIGPRLDRPYGVILHGAEVTIPGHLPGTRHKMAASIAGAKLLIAAGNYPAAEARRLAGKNSPTTVLVPPGVDTDRFHPFNADERIAARARFGVSPNARLVVSVSRLVPRKGMDVLIEAAARLAPTRPDFEVLIGGTGREEKRLQKSIDKLGAPVRLIGDVSEADLVPLFGAGDVFVMFARNRWLGLEQEGFGIVYLEAAACGVAQIAGRSGGTVDAVEDEVTGLIVDRGGDVVTASESLGRLLDDQALRDRLGAQARDRAVHTFRYDLLAKHLDEALVVAES